MLAPNDITVGLVVPLEPDVLEAWGSVSHVGADDIGHPQLMLCVSADASASVWVPLFPDAGPGRLWLSTNGRTGSSAWTHGRFYFRPEFFWRSSASAVIAAWAIGVPTDNALLRDRLDPAAIPQTLIRALPAPADEPTPG